MTTGTFTTKKVKTLPDEAIASSLEADSAGALKVDYGLAARTALQNVQQELATKDFEHWVRSELENTELREKLDILGRGQPRTQEAGSKVECHLGKDLRHHNRREENNVDHISRGPSSGEVLERAVRDNGSTSGQIRGLPETERPQKGF